MKCFSGRAPRSPASRDSFQKFTKPNNWLIFTSRRSFSNEVRVRGKVTNSTRLKATLYHVDMLDPHPIIHMVQGDKHKERAVYERYRAEWTYNSNAIEGSNLSLDDTNYFLKEGLNVTGNKFGSKDYLDALNHVEAINYLQEVVQDKGREIDAPLIKEFNSLLLQGVESIPAVDPYGNKVMRKISPGHYKKHPNHVLTFTGEKHKYVEPSDVKPQMDDLISWINEQLATNTLHPLIISSVAHYNMVRIHPFDDGNGRGARILMNLILMKSNSQPAIIWNEDREEYFELLNEIDKSGDLEPFTVFIGKSFVKTQDMLIKQTKKELFGNEDFPVIRIFDLEE